MQAYSNGESATQLAARLDLNVQAVIAALKRQGIKVRGMSAAIKLLDNGKRLEEINKQLLFSGEAGKRISAGHQKVDISEWDGFRKNE